MYRLAALNSTMVSLCGIFFVAECFFLNIFLVCSFAGVTLSYYNLNSVSLIFNLVVLAAFNIVDAHQHIDNEYGYFQNIINVDKQSTRLSEFVDRLLPRHI